MKTYIGAREPGGAAVYREDDAGRLCLLAWRLDLRNHSPTGLEWGYGGSGPSQLALAICADYLGDDAAALALYADFKWRVVAALDRDSWRLTGDEVAAALEQIKYESEALRRAIP